MLLRASLRPNDRVGVGRPVLAVVHVVVRCSTFLACMRCILSNSSSTQSHLQNRVLAGTLDHLRSIETKLVDYLRAFALCSLLESGAQELS